MLPFVLCAFVAFIALSTHASSPGISAPGNMIAEHPDAALQQCFDRFGSGQLHQIVAGVVQEWVACQLLEYIKLMQEITDIALRRAAAPITRGRGLSNVKANDLRNVQCVAMFIFYLSQNVNSGISWEGDHLYSRIEEIVELAQPMCLDGGGVPDGIPFPVAPDDLTVVTQQAPEEIVRFVLNTPILDAAHAATKLMVDDVLQRVVFWDDNPSFSRPGTGLYDVNVNRAWFRLVHVLRILVLYVWKEIAPGGDEEFNGHLAESISKADTKLRILITNVMSDGPKFRYKMTMPFKPLSDLRATIQTATIQAFTEERKRKASWLDPLETSARQKYKNFLR